MGIAVIVGAGKGLSASLARKFSARGMEVVLAARDPSDLEGLCAETGARAVACEASDAGDMARLFAGVDAMDGALEVAVYNPSARVRGPLVDLEPEAVRRAIEVTAFGAFLMGQEATRRMLPRGEGCILFTGASAGVKGFARSASFAMGKFALRGLAQSMARELHPQGVHVGHVVIDGGIDAPGGGDDAQLDPDAIAETYLHLVDQPRSCWAWEVEVRPWVEEF